MSSTASNYDISKLIIGQGAAILALCLSLGAAGPFISELTTASLPILGVTVLYGIMMFASSYVEEEQHFWYWTATAWLVLLWVKWYILRICSCLTYVLLTLV